MTESEARVLEAAIDLADWQSAYDAGRPAGAHIKKAQKWLCEAVAQLHGEHDGRYQIPDPENNDG